MNICNKEMFFQFKLSADLDDSDSLVFLMNRGSFEHKLDSEIDNCILEVSYSVTININQ